MHSTNKGFKEKIQAEICEAKDFYKKYPQRMVSDFKTEIGTEEDYNGRQLLELLQNADDEKSDEVEINLDTKNQTLTISNRGKDCTPFSWKGIRSLMIPRLSPKNSKKFIGNKGLGFRSIINWSEKITINSNNLEIAFSKDIVHEIYDELFTKKQQAEITEEFERSTDTKPIAFLSIPKITDNAENNWTTSITIQYKPNSSDDIKKQMGELRNEILLFLNHIKSLIIIIDGETKKEIDKHSSKWRIFSKEGTFPAEMLDEKNEADHYELKIALQDNLENDIKELFAYFPTKTDINFPFIVHGTFELDSSRNHLTDNKKNRYLLKKLATHIIETANNITKGDANYNALKMLSYSHRNNDLEGLGFYKYIDDAIKNLPIFPCLDGQYKKKSEIVYCNSLAKFIKQSHLCEVLSYLLIPTEDEKIKTILDNQVTLDKFYYFNGHQEDLEELNKKISNISDRAEFIHLLIDEKFSGKLPLLIDDEKKIISLDDVVYTPSTSVFVLPDFVKIRFINKKLFDKLIKFDLESSEKARELQRIKDITNIQNYEPATVLKEIVDATNKKIKDEANNQFETIKKMVQALYKNYQNLESFNISSDTKIQLLNKDGDLDDAKNLYLSKSYPSGKLTEYLFSDIFPSEVFLADIAIYDLQYDSNNSEKITEIENFFIKLGVNQYSKLEDTESLDADYPAKTIKSNGNKKVDYIKSTEAKEIIHLDLIKKISREKFVLWCLKDPNIQKYIDKELEVTYFGTHGGKHGNGKGESYIRHQLGACGFFKDFLIDNKKLSPLINNHNKKPFNFGDTIFQEHEITKRDIETILLKIGAVDKFEELSIETVNRIIKELPEKPEYREFAQTIYTSCITHFKKNKKDLKDKDIKLLATKDGKKDYFSAQEVFYCSKRLPKKITQHKPIFDYPRRQNSKQLTDFFGIKDYKELKITITNKKPIPQKSTEFKNIIEQIKPYILAHRIQNISSDDQRKKESDKLKKINIELCSYVEYNFDNNIDEFENNDYIKHEKSYVIKIDDSKSIDILKGEFPFQESFADIIGLVFDIDDTKIFRDLINDDITHIEDKIETDIDANIINTAKELLDTLGNENAFWQTIYKLKDKELSLKPIKISTEKIKNELKLKTNIENINFDNLNDNENLILLHQLFKELEISILDYNKYDITQNNIDFTGYHKAELKNAFNNNFSHFKKCLYQWCIDNGKEKEFTNHQHNYAESGKFIDSESDKLKEKITADYNKIVEQFINKQFVKNRLSLDIPTNIDFEKTHEKNKKEINNYDLDGNTEMESLLYFEKIDEIKAYIKSKEPTPLNIADTEKTDSVKEIKDITVSASQSPVPTIQNSHKPHKHSTSEDASKKRAGEESEKTVYDSLVNEYGKDDVHWNSKCHDGYGYDIKYKNEDGKWKCVEVKTCPGNKFHLTRKEKEFSEEHRGEYEIFLVDESKHLNRISDIDFSDGAQFRLCPTNFEVEFHINPTKHHDDR